MKNISLTIYGKVQGVYFRMETKKKADKLGIYGWVKNNPDGTVSLEAEGEIEKLKKLLLWCQNGPKHSQVKKVTEQWRNIIKNYTDFRIIK